VLGQIELIKSIAASIIEEPATVTEFHFMELNCGVFDNRRLFCGELMKNVGGWLSERKAKT